MKKYLWLIGLSFSLVLQNSCSNDLDIVDTWKEIPVVYGLFDPNSSVHYLRIEKAFLDENTSAYQIAQNPDSFYYKNITVELRESPANRLLGTMELVKGDTIGLPRETGIFANTPNYIYRYRGPISSGAITTNSKIEVRIKNNESGKEITAITPIIKPFRITLPNAGTVTTWDEDITSGQKVQWEEASNAAIFDIDVIFNYREFPANDPTQFTDKSIIWQAEKNFVPLSLTSPTTRLDGRRFYEFIGKNISANTNVLRCFTGIQVRVWAGGDALKSYINAQNAGTGLAGGVAPPPAYTNLSDGRGFISSRILVQQVGSCSLSNIGLDSLRNGRYTKLLNFLSKTDTRCQ